MIIVHVSADRKSVKKLEALAPGRPVPTLPSGTFVTDSVPQGASPEYLEWDGDTSSVKINAAKKAAFDAIDRRPPMERLVDMLETSGVLKPGDKARILER